MTPLHVPLESVASKLCHIYADLSVCSFSKTFSVSSVTWHTPPYIYIASRYPIDDALLTSKDRQDEGPWVTPSYTFAVPEDVVREALPIWDFLVAFGEQIDLTEFNFQQFQYGLLNCTSLIILLVGNLEEDIGGVLQRSNPTNGLSRSCSTVEFNLTDLCSNSDDSSQ